MNHITEVPPVFENMIQQSTIPYEYIGQIVHCR